MPCYSKGYSFLWTDKVKMMQSVVSCCSFFHASSLQNTMHKFRATQLLSQTFGVHTYTDVFFLFLFFLKRPLFGKKMYEIINVGTGLKWLFCLEESPQCTFEILIFPILMWTGPEITLQLFAVVLFYVNKVYIENVVRYKVILQFLCKKCLCWFNVRLK